MVIGLAGGVASGKSTVARAFGEFGAEVIDADTVGHSALLDAGVKESVAKRFGDGILGADGSIDRQRLGAEVFRDPAKRKDLEAITHPWIRTQIRSRLDQLLRESSSPAIVLDVSLLLESGAYDGDLDVVIYIETPQGVRESRASLNRSWAEGEVARRESHQLDLEAKRRRADVVIENSGSLSELKDQVRALWKRLVLGRKVGDTSIHP